MMPQSLPEARQVVFAQPTPHTLALPPPPQASPGVEHEPQSMKWPQPSGTKPLALGLTMAQPMVVQAHEPQTLGVPPPPQVWPLTVQPPQSSIWPQPSGIM